MDDALRRRLDAVIALLVVIAAVSVAALLLAFGAAGAAATVAIGFAVAFGGLLVDAELY